MLTLENAPNGTLVVIGHPGNGHTAEKRNGRWFSLPNGRYEDYDHRDVSQVLYTPEKDNRKTVDFPPVISGEADIASRIFDYLDSGGSAVNLTANLLDMLPLLEGETQIELLLEVFARYLDTLR